VYRPFPGGAEQSEVQIQAHDKNSPVFQRTAELLATTETTFRPPIPDMRTVQYASRMPSLPPSSIDDDMLFWDLADHLNYLCNYSIAVFTFPCSHPRIT
jgi:hypothetical protein